MGAFTPFKRHANEFKYKPRYYDPSKEARENRRAELRGERRDEANKEGEAREYRPGQFIRNSSEARNERRKGESRRGRTKLWITIGVMLFLAYMGSMLYSSLVDMLTTTTSPQSGVELSVEDEFNPYAPITVVPNDYEPNSEE